MDLFAPRHLLLILLVVLLVFGTKKLRTIGSDLGAAVKGFKTSMKEGAAEEQSAQAQQKRLPGEEGADAEFPESSSSSKPTGKNGPA